MSIPTYIILIIGLVLLVKGGGFLVEGTRTLATMLGISELVIGLTVVSIGTSVPELVVNLISGTMGHSDIAIGNILGSSIANVLLVLGIGALVMPIHIRFKEIAGEFWTMNLVFICFMVFALSGHILDRTEGILFIAGFIFFVWSSVIRGTHIENSTRSHTSLLRSLIITVVGSIMLYAGGTWVVKSVVDIAAHFHISQALIAVTIVAIGTSLPELTVTIISLIKKNPLLALGNAIGSNIFNMLWILGISATVSPLHFNRIFLLECSIFLSASILLALFLAQSQGLGRWQGAAFLLLYTGYLCKIVLRA